MVKSDAMMKKDEVMVKSDAMMKKDEVMVKSDAMMKKDEVMVKSDAMMKKDEVMVKSDAMMKKDEVMVKSDAMMKKDEVMVKSSWEYIDYSSTALSSALSSSKKVVLFFHASWCPNCRSLDANIRSEAAKIPANSVILKVDYDSETDLKRKYGVVTQTTLVTLDSKGDLLNKKAGVANLGEIFE
jgi:thiol-disulfide isomerase/thioredoxin